MWNHLPTSVMTATAALAFGAVALAVPTGDEEAVSSAPTPVELGAMPTEFVEMATWALGLFDDAELALPPMKLVYQGDDTAACSGWRGAHRSVDGVSIIDICTSDPGPATAALVLHEIAHAWASVDLSDQRKEDFQTLRGWTEWSNHADVAWHDNGAEQAAEIMVWGLIDRPLAIVTINDHSCDDLEAGYRVLTGQAPLHGFRDVC
jgi:hypothetical protein